MARCYIRWFEDIGADDVAYVGGKNASLGEMVRNLGRYDIKVPPGFAITADGYRHFLSANNLEAVIASRLAELDGKASVAEVGSALRAAVVKAEWPEDLSTAICQAYRELSQRSGLDETDVAVRSSATAEDLPMRALPVSRRPSSMFAARRCLTHAAVALLHSSPTAPSAIEKPRVSIT